MPALSGQTSNLDGSLAHSDLLIEKAVEKGIIESPVIPGRRFRVPGDAVDQARW
mgnify:CR=1 FL=1